MGFIINPYLVQPSVPAFTGLLDTYSGAAAAYSAARRLSSTYTGALIRVRRSSDNTEQDIGYDSNNVLDESALTTFVGANDGFVTTWYDQSGNANNAVQSTAANQAKIVSSGTIEKINNKPCVSIDGTDDFYDLTRIDLNASNFHTFVGKRDASARRLYGLSGKDIGSGHYLLTLWSDDNYYLQPNGQHYLVSNSTDTSTNQLLLTGQNISGTMSMYKNDSVIPSTQTAFNYANSINKIGIYTNTFLYAYCKLQEIVLYNSDQSSNRTGINSNINSFYSIY